MAFREDHMNPNIPHRVFNLHGSSTAVYNKSVNILTPYTALTLQMGHDLAKAAELPTIKIVC